MSLAPLVTLADIEAAAERIRGVPVPTPLLASPELSERVGGEVRLKCESLQRTGSFKARGATNFVSRLSREDLSRGVITYSSGNHAQATALAAKLNGVRAVVVMPTTAPGVKVRGAEALGAEVTFEGTTSEERKARAEEIASREGLTMVPPFDHPHIIAGQGTVGLETAREWPEMDTFVVPIGGGGLASGTSAAIRGLVPEARIVGVEPEGAASMKAALEAGRPLTLESIDTIADGLAPVRAGDLTFRHVREYVDEVVAVGDEAILEATRFLLARQKLVVEYSGAAAVAALLSGAVPAEGRKVAVVLSGGNLDPAILAELVE